MPKMALTVGVKTVMDSREVVVIITGIHKSYALHEVRLVRGPAFSVSPSLRLSVSPSLCLPALAGMKRRALV